MRDPSVDGLRCAMNFLAMFVNPFVSMSFSALIFFIRQTAGEISSKSLLTLLVKIFIRRSRTDRLVESEWVKQRKCAVDDCQFESLGESHRATSPSISIRRLSPHRRFSGDATPVDQRKSLTSNEVSEATRQRMPSDRCLFLVEKAKCFFLSARRIFFLLQGFP